MRKGPSGSPGGGQEMGQGMGGRRGRQATGELRGVSGLLACPSAHWWGRGCSHGEGPRRLELCPPGGRTGEPPGSAAGTSG